MAMVAARRAELRTRTAPAWASLAPAAVSYRNCDPSRCLLPGLRLEVGQGSAFVRMQWGVPGSPHARLPYYLFPPCLPFAAEGLRRHHISMPARRPFRSPFPTTRSRLLHYGASLVPRFACLHYGAAQLISHLPRVKLLLSFMCYKSPLVPSAEYNKEGDRSDILEETRKKTLYHKRLVLCSRAAIRHTLSQPLRELQSRPYLIGH